MKFQTTQYIVDNPKGFSPNVVQWAQQRIDQQEIQKQIIQREAQGKKPNEL